MFTTKRMMVPPPGRVFIEVDLSQIEVRVLAALSRDKNLILDMNTPGFDPHCMSGAFSLGRSYAVFKAHFDAGEESYIAARRKGKTISFEFQYGAKDENIASRNNIPLKDVQNFSENYKKTYKDVVNFHERNIRNVNRDSGLLSIDVLCEGQNKEYPRYWNVALNKFNKYSKNQIMNYPVQGIAYDVIKLAWIQPVSSKILKHRQVHDSILYSVPESNIDVYYQEITSIFNKLPALVNTCMFDFPVILPYEVKTGFNLKF